MCLRLMLSKHQLAIRSLLTDFHCFLVKYSCLSICRFVIRACHFWAENLHIVFILSCPNLKKKVKALRWPCAVSGAIHIQWTNKQTNSPIVTSLCVLMCVKAVQAFSLLQTQRLAWRCTLGPWCMWSVCPHSAAGWKWCTVAVPFTSRHTCFCCRYACCRLSTQLQVCLCYRLTSLLQVCLLPPY